MSTILCVAAAIITLLVGILAGLSHRHLQALRVMDALTVRTRHLEERDRLNVAASRQILTNLAPLLEQTDWMTGRWAGKFNELVALEAKRNESAVKVRKALMSTPGLTDFHSQYGYELFTAAMTGAAKEILG